MKRFLLVLCCLGGAQAQFSAPPVGITVKEGAAPKLEVARTLGVQPAALALRLAPGHSAGMLTFSVLSPVNAEVRVRASDARLTPRQAGDERLILSANTLQSVTLLATAPHSGVLSFLNSEGQLVASAPYTVAAAKTVNQSLSLNYSPSSSRASMNYGISGVPQSPLDLRWNASVNLSVDTKTGQVGGGVGVNMSW
ncbi:hypothetical protein GO986_15280 [Deinococcus sp. HMF7620]|uniref:Uncharacterized protein n=1 Tax=Deinococcus arboris TaxID=2682977 RepID=A0A7C9HSV5_9DEIO|nr:hypothetical protein [Deinococcus arboris]MVN88114.1 hypothetical protein [Deinococcus arboris]